MTATLTLLGAVARDPQKGFATIAGVEEVNVRNELRSVSFYHRLRLPRYLEVTAGDGIFAHCNIEPDAKVPGRVNLNPVEIRKVDGLSTKRDERGNILVVRGVNLAQASGKVTQDVQQQQFEDKQAVLNFSLLIDPMLGLLEVSSYGLTAQSMAGIQKGDDVIVQGRLITQRKATQEGAKYFTKLETFRQSIMR